jgi:protein phosphatase
MASRVIAMVLLASAAWTSSAQAGREPSERSLVKAAARPRPKTFQLTLPLGARQPALRALRISAKQQGLRLQVLRNRRGFLESTFELRFKKLAAKSRAGRAAPTTSLEPSWTGMRFGVHTETNLREENQDVADQITSQQGDLLLLLFDGAGGHAGGAAAARKGANDVRDHFANAQGDALTTLESSFHRANVSNLFSGRGGQRVGVTTAVGAVVTADGRLITANLGDSRAYRYSPASRALTRLTHDHNGPEDNVITEYLGRQDGVNPEMRDHGKLASGERILLCSDGLHKFVRDDVIRHHLGRNVSPDQIARDLASLAKQNGSDDNITIHIYQHP